MYNLNIMRKVLYVILKNTTEAFEILETLKNEGFNGTLIGSNSLKHAIDSFPEENHFLNLRHIEDTEISESILCMFVWEEETIEIIRNRIREMTDHFQKVHGFMFSKNVEDYEGTL